MICNAIQLSGFYIEAFLKFFEVMKGFVAGENWVKLSYSTNIFDGRMGTTVCIGVSTLTPPFSCQAPLKSANCPSSPFLDNPPSVLEFHEPP